MFLGTDALVLYEDEHLLFINKPCGLIVNRSSTSPDNTLQDFLDTKIAFSHIQNEDFVQRSGIVHRLDKDTSGVLVVAKSPKVFYSLQRKFKRREVRKKYIAVVFGRVVDPIIEIDAPIGRDPKNRQRMCILQGGREAFTKLQVQKSLSYPELDATLLEAYPLSGRTHQIRVHCLALGHPILGDKIYMTKSQLRTSSNFFSRLMLHAHTLEVAHPITNQMLTIKAPLPTEFVQLVGQT